MLTTLLGTCRLRPFKKLLDCTTINDDVSFVHSTKEMLQLIKVIRGQISLSDDMMRYAFRTGIINGKPVEISQEIVDQLNNSELFILEICSMKKYVYKDVYLHHLSVDSRWDWEYWKYSPSNILSETVIKEQTKEEIETDIEELQSLLSGKKIIVVSHMLPESDKLQKRKYLIDLLIAFCKKKGLDIILPTEGIVEGIVTSDLGHYIETRELEMLPYFKKRLIEIGILKEMDNNENNS